MITTEIIVILILILVNGYFAAAELALVTSRKHRLQVLQDQGTDAAAEVIRVKETPGHILATVQVGISLIGSLASAYGGASISPVITQWLSQIEVLKPYAQQLSLLLLVLGLTYLTLIFGELVPKQLALRNPERMAIMLYRPLKWLEKLASPLVRLLSVSTDAILRLLPRGANTPSTSAEEIEQLLQQGTAEGIFQRSEEAFVSGVFDYSDRQAHDVMTTRTEIAALDVKLTPKEALNQAALSGFSRFPIYESHLDNVIGYAHIKDLIWADKTTSLRDIARQVILVPESATLPDVYKHLTTEHSHMAIVLDEHGGTAGLLTLEDVLEVIVGEINDEYHISRGDVSPLGKGAWLVAGATPVDELSEVVGVEIEADDAYNTAAGLVMSELGHIPHVGEVVHYKTLSFSVRQMDNLRIEQLLVQRMQDAPAKS
ncbi:MAG TPA: hemolysin family protein [Anaerolineales bacterium]|nr:hemolysin family protein [Anaerolineales bacterium]HRQ93001.1 hemolysin family protein [Anaerolineales bacterium]